MRKATDIAEWLCRRDPADRKARFDLASAKYCTGVILMIEAGRAHEALEFFEAAAGLLSGLENEDPANLRYRFVSLYVQRKIGETLETLGRHADAARKFAGVRMTAETFRGAKNEASVLTWAMLAGLELVKLKAQAGDAGAISLADRVASALEEPSIQQALANAWSRAWTYGQLGTVYLRMEKGAPAAYWLEKSRQAWREMKVPAALEEQRNKLEEQRNKEVTAVEASLERARRTE